jgi:hypothetical protein
MIKPSLPTLPTFQLCLKHWTLDLWILVCQCTLLPSTAYSRVQGYLENPQQQSIESPPRASSRTRFLRSPHANAGMKQYEFGRTQPFFRVGHDHGINKRSKPKGLRQY